MTLERVPAHSSACCAKKRCPKLPLHRLVDLLSPMSHVEHIDSFMRLGIDQHDLYIAFSPCKHRCEIIEQPGAIFADEIDKRCRIGSIIVEADLRRKLSHACGTGRWTPPLQEHSDVLCPQHYALQSSADAIDLGRVQFQISQGICESQLIDHKAGFIVECFRFHNAEPEAREGAA